MPLHQEEIETSRLCHRNTLPWLLERWLMRQVRMDPLLSGYGTQAPRAPPDSCRLDIPRCLN